MFTSSRADSSAPGTAQIMTYTSYCPKRRQHALRPVRLGRAAAARGFTLTELLTVMAVGGVLMALLISVTRQVTRKAYATKDINQMTQIGVAHARYMADHNMEAIPPHAPKPDNPAKNQVWYYEYLRPYLDVRLLNTVEASLLISPLDPSHGGRDQPDWNPSNRRSYAVNRYFLKKNSRPLRVLELERPQGMFWLINYEVYKKNTNAADPTSADSLKYIPEDWVPGGMVHLLFLDGRVEAIRKAEIMPDGSRADVFGPWL